MNHFFNLNNGNKIPQLGLGTYRITSQPDMTNALKCAFENNMFLIDTAEMYGNEIEIGNALKELQIDRNKVFITSKVWDSSQSYKETLLSFEKSLKKLQTDYLDLYLIHWPSAAGFLETWRALEHIYTQGLAKNIGVSNFSITDLNILFANAKIKPAVNQIEIHPYYQNRSLIEFCKKNDILVQSWSPLAKGKVAHDGILTEIGRKYDKTAVQITLKWHIQQNFNVFPKSSKCDRIKEFADIFDFELTENDMRKISNLS